MTHEPQRAPCQRSSNVSGGKGGEDDRQSERPRVHVPEQAWRLLVDGLHGGAQVLVRQGQVPSLGIIFGQWTSNAPTSYVTYAQRTICCI